MAHEGTGATAGRAGGLPAYLGDASRTHLSATPADETLLRPAVRSLAVLPGLTDGQLGLLLDRPASAAGAVLRRLRSLGWAQDLLVARAGADPVRLWFLSPAAEEVVAAAAAPPLRAQLPLGYRERLLRIVRPELTALTNGYVAALAAAARGLGLHVAPQGLPWLAAPGSAPPGTAAALCFAAGRMAAAAFVAADHRALEHARRVDRVAGWVRWYAEDDSRLAAPTVCLVPSVMDARAYAAAARSRVERRGLPQAPILLAPPGAALREPLGEIYRCVETWQAERVLERVRAGRAAAFRPAELAAPEPAMSPLPPPPPVVAPRGGGGPGKPWRPKPGLHGAAQLTLGLDRLGAELLTLAHHLPRLPLRLVPDALGVEERGAGRVLASLAADGLIFAGAGEVVLTGAGAGLLAARSGASPQVRVHKDPLPPAPPRPHDARCLELVARAARAAAARGWRLTTARLQQQHEFTVARRTALIPDVTAELETERAVAWFCLELDQGSADWRRVADAGDAEFAAAKLGRYEAMLAAFLAEGIPPGALPWILVVTSAVQREFRFWEALRQSRAQLVPRRLLTTHLGLLETGTLLDPVWKTRELFGRPGRAPFPPSGPA